MRQEAWTSEYPERYRAALTHPSPLERARAARSIPLEDFVYPQLRRLFQDADDLVVRALLDNPSLQAEQAEWIYDWCLGDLDFAQSSPQRRRWAADSLVVRGLPCSKQQGQTLWWRLWDAKTPEERHRVLSLMLRLSGEHLSESFVTALWPSASSFPDLAVECVSHPLAGPELWEMAAYHVLERENAELAERMSVFFGLYPRALALEPVAEVVSRWGLFEAQAALAANGPAEFFGGCLEKILTEETAKESYREEIALVLMQQACAEKVAAVLETTWARLLGAAEAQLRLLAIRLRGTRAAERGIGCPVPGGRGR